MDVAQQFLNTFLGILLGFVLSQSVNIVSYFRRPKFTLDSRNCIISSYTGDPPDVAAEIHFGFSLKNSGKNTAKNTRVFISDICV